MANDLIADASINNEQATAVERRAYHATNEEFEGFDPNFIGTSTDSGHLGHGFYWSTDPKINESRDPLVKGRRKNRLVEANLTLNNPLEVSLPDWRTDKRAVVRESLGLPETATARDISEALSAKGHDGVVLDYSPVGYNHQEIMVLDANQIRDPSNLPALIAKTAALSLPDEPPPKGQEGRGQMFRGIGALMRRRIFPLIQAAQLGYGHLLSPEQKAEVQEFLSGSVHEFVGLEKPGVEYFKDLFGLSEDPAELPMDQASRMARAQEMGLTTDAYHATQSDFPAFKNPDESYMLDRMLGTHFAADPRASSNLLEHETTGKTMGEGARIIPTRLPDGAKFLTVEQKPHSWAGNVENRKPWQAIEGDQGVIERMVMNEAYKQDPEMLARYLVDARAVPEKDAGGFARRLIAGETVTLPVDGPVNGLDSFVKNHGGKPYNAADRKRAVELAQNLWTEQGYSGLKYTNTSPMETMGISDATSYIVFDPKNIRSRFAKFDPAKKDSARIDFAAGGFVDKPLYDNARIVGL